MPKLTLNSSVKLNNGLYIPAIGLGVWQISDGQPAIDAVRWALEDGYRHIDTAKIYRNEKSVGEAISNSEIPRENIWVTTKLWPSDAMHVKKALEASLERLGLDYVDLYLIHWPIPGMGKKVWKDMENLVDEKLTRSIGVSNYSVSLLEKTIKRSNIPPAVNQVKCSPFNYPEVLYKFCIENGIAFEGYSPLTQGKRLDDPILSDMSKKYNKTTAQILIRWALQKGIIVIPKSQNRERIRQNINVFDFDIDQNDMERLDGLSEEPELKST